MKTKNTKQSSLLLTTLVSVMTLAVVLLSTHAKDLVAVTPSTTPDATNQPARTQSPMEKSLGELHHHVDKTMVKDPGVSKVFGDNSALAARREREEIEEERPLSLKMIEMMLMIKLAYAYAVG